MAVIWNFEVTDNETNHLTQDELDKFLWQMEETCRAIIAHWSVSR